MRTMPAAAANSENTPMTARTASSPRLKGSARPRPMNRDVSDRLGVVGGDLGVDLDGGVERARQWRVLDHRNAVLARHLPDLEGDGVDALGDADRRVLAALVLQGHRIVGRVGDDHRRLGY